MKWNIWKEFNRLFRDFGVAGEHSEIVYDTAWKEFNALLRDLGVSGEHSEHSDHTEVEPS